MRLKGFARLTFASASTFASAATLVFAVTLACGGSSSPGGPTGGPPVAADPGTWEVRRGLTIPRTENSVAELNGSIWVVGGFGFTGGAVTEVERYDPAADAWTEVAPIPQGVNHAGLAAIGGRLLVVGGNVGSTFAPAATVRAYDPATDA
ncbi:MAG: kelch repeat-containing protein, partial [Gemmatimonadota bacterium]